MTFIPFLKPNQMRRFFSAMLLFSLLSFTKDPGAASLSGSFTDPPINGGDLTVSYAIEVRSKKSNTGIAETYNGGVETLFITGHQARLRLVSLMRMQSIYLFSQDPERRVTIVKESGHDKYKYHLNGGEWKAYNKKYEGVKCLLTED